MTFRPMSITRPRLGALWVQLGIVAGSAILYFAVRHLTQGEQTLAEAHGATLVSLERSLHLDWEHTAQAMALSHQWATTAFNWIYIYGHWPVITITLFYLFYRRPEHYRWLRNSMMASGAIGIVVFAAYPVAPPRLLADTEYVDTVTTWSNSYRVLQPPDLVNKYAALPSLHVGWNLLVGIILFDASRRRLVRAFAVICPPAMAVAVVATGNHYVIDVFAGAVTALMGMALALWLESVRDSGRLQRSRATA